jgi:broad specificity phosphatase PhoE
MKTIYFVRHGESEGNSGPIRQTSAANLTDKGIAQAKIVADRCTKIPFETIICSTMERTKQTANYILEKNDKPIEYSDLFIERRRSSEVLGKPKDDPASIEIERQVREHFCDLDWHYSDEENFADLKDRALACLEYLEKRPEQNLLVVSHGFFLRIIAACVVFGKNLTAKEGERFVKTLHTKNTGMTIFEHQEGEKEPWVLWVWNDHAHLG